MLQPRRVIVRTPNWLGDHVMAWSFYRGLRRAFPNAEITALLPQSLLGLFIDSPFDQEWSFKKTELKDSQGHSGLVDRIKDACFDLAVSLPSSWSSALLFWKARVPQRIGFSEMGNSVFYQKSLAWRGVHSGKHKSDLYSQILSLISQPAIEPESFRKEDKPPREDFWILAPGAALPLREWPFFPELLFKLKEMSPHQKILVIGSDLEAAWKTRLKRWNLPFVEDWIGKTSLPDLVKLCSRAKLVIANDSGVAHVSATISKAPTLVLFGPGDPHYIRPLGPSVISLTPPSEIHCSPCEKAYCKAPMGYARCLKEISVHSVINTMKQNAFL